MNNFKITTVAKDFFSRCPWLAPLFVVFVLSSSASAQTLEPIRYTVSFPAPNTHYVEVEGSFPTDGQSSIELMMAVWTPGSYLIREYSQHVEAISATSPARTSVRIEKTRKNRWRLETSGASTVSLRYRVYSHEMSVRTNWVDDEFALLNGAPTFITLLESPSRRVHEVRVVLPRQWSQSFSGMATRGEDNTYVAPDYDTLVDSPILAGNPAVYEFRVSGIPHYLVNFRERGAWNRSQPIQDLTRLAETTIQFWGDAPFDRFYFFNILGARRNGLEHRNSTVLNSPRDSTGSRDAYVDWLSLAAHEYFHAWNVKRLRPRELGPFDYENEVYTNALWFAEGVTDYYADLLLARAGVTTRAEYLNALSSQIRALQTTPGRLEQSAEMASYDAWIKYYRPTENTPNSSISYYVKGAVIGFVLDAKLRAMTSGEHSLDELMRDLYERFSGESGFAAADIRAAVVSLVPLTGAPTMRDWLERTLTTTAELDYTEAMEWFGLTMTAPPEKARAWLGVAIRRDNDRTIVTEVRRESPAAGANLSPGDEIKAINGDVARPDQFSDRIAKFSPGATITLLISRDEVERKVEVRLGSDPGHRWTVGVSPNAGREQSERLTAWLQSR